MAAAIAPDVPVLPGTPRMFGVWAGRPLTEVPIDVLRGACRSFRNELAAHDSPVAQGRLELVLQELQARVAAESGRHVAADADEDPLSMSAIGRCVSRILEHETVRSNPELQRRTRARLEGAFRNARAFRREVEYVAAMLGIPL